MVVCIKLNGDVYLLQQDSSVRLLRCMEGWIPLDVLCV